MDGLGIYGMVLLLAVVFIGLSLVLLATRWYVFPLLYLNFSYFGTRFVAVQDGSYLVMLVVVIAALLRARRRVLGHALMAVAIAMKVSPVYHDQRLQDGAGRPGSSPRLCGRPRRPVRRWDNYSTSSGSTRR